MICTEGLSVDRLVRITHSSGISVYRTTLEKDIISDTSGHFKRLMVSMATVSIARILVHLLGVYLVFKRLSSF